MALRLCVLALLVASVNACCSPLQWEMTGGTVSGRVAIDDLTLTEFHYDLHYDAVNLKVAMRSEYVTSNIRNMTILDYEAGRIYQVDEVTGACEIRTLDTPFEPSCTPADATVNDHFFVGGGDQERLPAASFKYVRPDKSGYVTVTEGDSPDSTCVPIVAFDFNLSEMTFMVFRNIMDGIADPSIFDPPDSCNFAKETPLKRKMNVHPFLRFPVTYQH
ncbi:mammalian ependymin-related protein 1-like [Haliotis rufescens]|uniref:mammalian ependymin-related protein 1-like n=1 Tax=Haliotis rufescens TaxID=6454 RepID=UPI001EAFB158|nr:mammalian ependymin-related protein 1-like [Haliotis rufescens]